MTFKKWSVFESNSHTAYVSLSVHCFNNYNDQTICPNLEVSYLIECKIPPEQNTVQIQRRNRQNNFSCAINAHVTAPIGETTTASSISKTTTINFVYLMIIFVLQQIWNKYTRVHFWPKYCYFRKKNLISVFEYRVRFQYLHI